jgi:hypothetical protein
MTPINTGDWLYIINSPCPLPEEADAREDVLHVTLPLLSIKCEHAQLVVLQHEDDIGSNDLLLVGIPTQHVF